MEANLLLMFDFLGFKDYTRTHSYDDVLTLYIRNLYFAEYRRSMAPDCGKGFEFIVFSDTVCFYSTDKAPQELFGLLLNTKSLIADSFIFGGREAFPVRGALAYGEFLASKEGEWANHSTFGLPPQKAKSIQILIGEAVVDAYELEKTQKWIGASFSPKSATHFAESHPKLLDMLKQKLVLVDYQIPTADGPIWSLALNYVTTFEPESFYRQVKRIEESIPEQSIRAKYTASRIFVEHILENHLAVEEINLAPSILDL